MLGGGSRRIISHSVMKVPWKELHSAGLRCKPKRFHVLQYEKAQHKWTTDVDVRGKYEEEVNCCESNMYVWLIVVDPDPRKERNKIRQVASTLSISGPIEGLMYHAAN
jgi:hypothetical protein